MHDTLAAKAKELDEYLKHLKPLPNQKGLVALINGEVAGADIVSSARAYQVLHSKFIRSYALEALMEQKQVLIQNARDKMDVFLKSCLATAERIHPVVGCGQDHRFEGMV